MTPENPPPSVYKIDQLCSIQIGAKILEINLFGGLFDIPTVLGILERIEDYTKGKQYFTIINCDRSARTTFKALRVMGRPEAMTYALAKAYVIRTLHQKIMANVFLLFFRPSKPVKFFRDPVKARQWLKELI